MVIKFYGQVEFKLSILLLFIFEMSKEGPKDSIYCSHCDEMVSRSTYTRHQRKRSTITISAKAGVSSLSSSEGEGKLSFELAIFISIHV